MVPAQREKAGRDLQRLANNGEGMRLQKGAGRQATKLWGAIAQSQGIAPRPWVGRRGRRCDSRCQRGRQQR